MSTSRQTSLAVVALVLGFVSGTARAATCNSTATSLAQIQSQVAAADGGTVCVAAGSYGKLTLNASKASKVIVRPVPGATVTLNGVDITGKHLDLRGFVITGEVAVQSLTTQSSFITIACNDISGGYYGVNLISQDCTAPNAPTWSGCGPSPKVTDVLITGNKIHGMAATAEDAIHINNFSRVTVSYNEIYGVVEGGNHNDCLQAVFGGNDLVFDHNYEHDNNCQGFFLKDGDVVNATVTNNLFVRNRVAGLDEGTVQVFDTKGYVFRNNTDWSGNANILRAPDGTNYDATVDHNVIQTFNNGCCNETKYLLTEDHNVFGSNPYTFTKSATSTVVANPAFVDAAHDDYRLVNNPNNIGVNWKPADYVYGPGCVDALPGGAGGGGGGSGGGGGGTGGAGGGSAGGAGGGGGATGGSGGGATGGSGGGATGGSGGGATGGSGGGATGGSGGGATGGFGGGATGGFGGGATGGFGGGATGGFGGGATGGSGGGGGTTNEPMIGCGCATTSPLEVLVLLGLAIAARRRRDRTFD